MVLVSPVNYEAPIRNDILWLHSMVRKESSNISDTLRVAIKKNVKRLALVLVLWPSRNDWERTSHPANTE